MDRHAPRRARRPGPAPTAPSCPRGTSELPIRHQFETWKQWMAHVRRGRGLRAARGAPARRAALSPSGSSSSPTMRCTGCRRSRTGVAARGALVHLRDADLLAMRVERLSRKRDACAVAAFAHRAPRHRAHRGRRRPRRARRSSWPNGELARSRWFAGRVHHGCAAAPGGLRIVLKRVDLIDSEAPHRAIAVPL